MNIKNKLFGILTFFLFSISKLGFAAAANDSDLKKDCQSRINTVFEWAKLLQRKPDNSRWNFDDPQDRIQILNNEILKWQNILNQKKIKHDAKMRADYQRLEREVGEKQAHQILQKAIGLDEDEMSDLTNGINCLEQEIERLKAENPEL